MLAENLVDKPSSVKPLQIDSGTEKEHYSVGQGNKTCVVRTSEGSVGLYISCIRMLHLFCLLWFLEKTIVQKPSLTSWRLIMILESDLKMKW